MRAHSFSHQVCKTHSSPVRCTCSVNEPGLYDYIICNDNLERAGAELQAVADRALKGLVGRPADQPPAASPSAAAPQVRMCACTHLCLLVPAQGAAHQDVRVQCLPWRHKPGGTGDHYPAVLVQQPRSLCFVRQSVAGFMPSGRTGSASNPHRLRFMPLVASSCLP